ncbi:MAG: hypothetical protein Q9212_007387 [Teloschistes hypoglaucus]
MPDITTERVIIALPDGTLPDPLSAASLGDITCRTWNHDFFYRTLDIGENRCIVRLNGHPHRPKYREWLGVENGKSVWGSKWVAYRIRTGDGLGEASCSMESNQLVAMSRMEERRAKRGRDASRERRRSSSPIILHESPDRHIAVKHEGNELTRTLAPRELLSSTPITERDVSMSSPLTELESVTKRRQEVERQLEMIMALTNESRQLARREEELTRAASLSS